MGYLPPSAPPFDFYMSVLLQRRAEAEYGLRQHSSISAIKSRTTYAAIAGISFFVGSTAMSAVSSTRKSVELPVAASNMGLVAAFAARQSRMVRDRLEALLKQKHALHPVIVNKAFDDLKNQLHQATHTFMQGMQDNDKGTLVVTD
jgi:hypothetical protein